MLLLKSAGILLYQESDAKDLANFERYRPAVPTRNLMTDALIPGQFALSPEAKANYDAIDWSSPEIAAKIQDLIARGAIRINTAARPSDLRVRGQRGKVYECREHEQIFSGPAAKVRWRRHMQQAHGRVPTESTTVAVSGGPG